MDRLVALGGARIADERKEQSANCKTKPDHGPWTTRFADYGPLTTDHFHLITRSARARYSDIWPVPQPTSAMRASPAIA